MRIQLSRFVLGVMMSMAIIVARSPCARLPRASAAKLRIAQDDSTISIYDGNRPVLPLSVCRSAQEALRRPASSRRPAWRCSAIRPPTTSTITA